LSDERVSPRDVVVLEAKVGGDATPGVRGHCGEREEKRYFATVEGQIPSRER
jgi:hypothetical protein